MLAGAPGDGIAPPHLMRQAAQRLRSWEAPTSVTILDEDLPHMFPAFETAAEQLAEIISAPK
jgi:hypothetical protein